MFQHRIYDKAEMRTYVDWFLLAFLAGYINSGGFLICNQFVSHITGFATITGISIAKLNWIEALGALVIPLFFLAGVMISGFLTERNLTTERMGHKYAPVMRIVGFILLMVSFLGHFNYFGEFGNPGNIQHNFLLLALLCGACGLQNGAITSASGATVRTTHLTGLTTDLGLGLVRASLSNESEEQKLLDRRANLARVLTIISFIFGSTVGGILLVKLKYVGFFPAAILAFYFWWSAARQQNAK